MTDPDPDVERITALVREGLAHDRDDAPSELRLADVVIVAMWLWTDDEGDEREGASVWGESRRQYVKRGVLEAGIQTLTDASDVE